MQIHVFCFLIKFGMFFGHFFPVFFVSLCFFPFTLEFPCCVYVGTLDGVLQVPQFLLGFLQPLCSSSWISSMDLPLSWPTLFSACSNPTLKLSSEFFISVIVISAQIFSLKIIYISLLISLYLYIVLVSLTICHWFTSVTLQTCTKQLT